MRSCLWGQVAVAAALLTTLIQGGSTARADALADARKAVEGSDYMSAEPALESALKAGTADPADLAEIYKLTGVVEAALGNTGPSEQAFARWLALEPKGSLPAGTSPKITRPFSAAQAQAKKHGPLAAKAETNDDPPAVTLVIENDPLKMIVGAKVYFVTDKKAEETLEADGHGKITIELGTGKRIDLRLHAVDQYGNRVVELGSKDVPIVITSTGEAKKLDEKDRELLVKKKEPAAPDEPRPWYFQWWTWGAATVVTAGVGGYFAWQTRSDINELEYLNANSLAHPWSDAQDVERRARRDLLVTNISAGVAGAFAIGTVILYVTRPRTSETIRAAITPTRGGGAVVLGGHF